MAFKDYEEMVNTYLKDNSTEVFGNFSSEHAGFIIASFLESAENSVDIFSGTFADAFYSAKGIDALLIQTARRLQKNNGRIRIITISGEKSDLLNKLEKEINDPKSFSYISAKFKGAPEPNHFMIVDNMRYRLEAPHPPFDETSNCIHAEVCCNGKAKAAELTHFFDRAWKVLEDKAKEKAVSKK